MNQLYTAESVTEGHPDKLCDIIADSVLDACLAHDLFARVACEVLATKGNIIVAGEITSQYEPEIPAIVRSVLKKVGYDPAPYAIQCLIHKQSPDIAAGVDCSLEQRRGRTNGNPVLEMGAGDQGVMVGYACSETPQMLPLPVVLARRLTNRLTMVRKSGAVPGLGPDGKAQVTVEYDEAGKPLRLDTVVLSAQHSPEKPVDELFWQLTDSVLEPALPLLPPDENTKILLNPIGLCWAARRPTPASPGGSSWWTATAYSRPTAGVRSPERIPPRWTVPGPTWRGTSPRTWWRQGCAANARSRWRMPSEWRSRSWWRWIPSAPARFAPTTVWRTRCGMCSA